MAKTRGLLPLVVILANLEGSAVLSTTPENQLYNDLLTGYNTGVRPLYDPHQQMVVDVTFMLKKIESFNEQTQVLNSFGWIIMTWTDEILEWDPYDYNLTTRLVLPASKIWLPEIAMFNSVNQGNDLSLDVKFRASVTYEGFVIFAPGYKWSTECKVALEAFPYDTQTCTVTFVNWVYGMDSLMYTATNLDLITYEEHDQWRLTNSSVGAGQLLTTDPGPVPQVYFSITLQRKPLYYVLNVVVPCFMVAILSCLVFLIPSDSGEKVSLAVTILLSYTVLLLMMSEVTPKSGESLPYISMFIVMNMVLTGLSLVITVLIMNLYHHPASRSPPQCLRSLVFGCLARLVCMRGEVREYGAGKVSPAGDSTSLASILRHSDVQVHEMDEHAGSGRKAAGVGDGGLLPADVLAYVRYLMENEREAEAEGQCRAEWMALGRVMDSFMLGVFLVATAIGIVAYLSLVYQ